MTERKHRMAHASDESGKRHNPSNKEKTPCFFEDTENGIGRIVSGRSHSASYIL
jgi:hypothetical protein